MKIVYRLLLVLLISLFLFGCGGKKGGTVEGKVVDGLGQPLSGVTLVFKQVRPVSDAEPLQAKTDSDGTFSISGLTPSSEYIITPETDKWTTKVTRKITAGQSLALSPPIAIRFQLLKNGTIIDTKTGLQWLIYTATDISATNVMNTVKNINEGGSSDWRLPTKTEILGLKDQTSTVSDQAEPKIAQQACCVWTAEINSDSIEWEFYIDDGNELWTSSRMPPNDRVVVVRTYGASPTAQAPTIVVPSPVAAALNKQATPSPSPVAAPQAPTATGSTGGAVNNTIVIHFDPKKSSITNEDLDALKSFYTKFKNTPGSILVEGHSDAAGSKIGSVKDSVELALNTLTLLMKMGLSDKTDLELKGMGNKNPVADKNTPEGRNKNRRVELTFTPG